MSDTNRPRDDGHYPTAREKIRRFSPVWLIPIVAAIIAIYLGIHDIAEHGPLIDVTFKTAQGLSAGQTQVKYKSVTIGTVESVKFDDEMQNVIARIRMTATAKPLLTNKARLWVVRPELNTFNASDIETLVSGSYIRLSPGPEVEDEEKTSETHFIGKETPPADSSDEAGRVFVLKADRLDSLNVGSPVYFRDINVGQILGYDIGTGFEPITITAFVRQPYDKYVRRQSRFWNTSGFSVKLGGGGFHLETHSLRSVLSGGVAFLTPQQAQNDAPADPKTIFALYDTQNAAEAAVYDHSILYTAYFKSSVKDLVPGAPVMIYGVQVGSVTNVALEFKADQTEPRVRVDFNIQPERVFGPVPAKQTPDTTAIMRDLVANGMRVKLDAGAFIIGQKALVLEFTPGAEPAPVTMEGDAIVLPSAGGGANMMDAVTDVANKLNQIPFGEIGMNLNALIKNANQTVGSDDMKKAIHDLATTMAKAADLTTKADENLTPALQRLPDISAQLQEAAKHANGLMSGLDTSFGEGSDFQHDARHTLDQVNDAARSIRLLADFLERHPEALLSGKSYQKDKP